MEILFLQFAALLGSYLVSHFMTVAAVKSLSDEEKSRLIDHFSHYRLYGLILFFVPMAFIYNNLIYVSVYVGIFFIIMLLLALYIMHKIRLPANFMRRYHLSRAVVLLGVMLYFMLLWIKYAK